MNFGAAVYIEGGRLIEGELILDESRLYIQSNNISSSTYIPLDKIILLRKKVNGLEIKVKLSAINSLFVKILISRSAGNKLIKDIVRRLKLKKKFFKSEWVGQASWR